jgi:putative ABC transport system ATP-binding protein
VPGANRQNTRQFDLVGALDRPTAGRVSIDGAPLADLCDDDGLTRVRRDKIGFIF